MVFSIALWEPDFDKNCLKYFVEKKSVKSGPKNIYNQDGLNLQPLVNETRMLSQHEQDTRAGFLNGPVF